MWLHTQSVLLKGLTLTQRLLTCACVSKHRMTSEIFLQCFLLLLFWLGIEFKWSCRLFNWLTKPAVFSHYILCCFGEETRSPQFTVTQYSDTSWDLEAGLPQWTSGINPETTGTLKANRSCLCFSFFPRSVVPRSGCSQKHPFYWLFPYYLIQTREITSHCYLSNITQSYISVISLYMYLFALLNNMFMWKWGLITSGRKEMPRPKFILIKRFIVLISEQL